jgi:hypothetical protein
MNNRVLDGKKLTKTKFVDFLYLFYYAGWVLPNILKTLPAAIHSVFGRSTPR